MQSGDVVLLWQSGKNSGLYALGELIDKPYQRDWEVSEAEARPYENSDWWVKFRYARILEPFVPRDVIKSHPDLASLSILKAPQGSNFRVTPEEWAAIQELIPPEPIAPLPLPTNPIYTLDQCADDTSTDVELLRTWVGAIARKKQAIVYGPTGTGKTYMAEHLARHLISGGDGFTQLVQFHPAYAYEDFIQGIRPQSSEDGHLSYPLLPGRFLEFCDKARSRSGTCVLIIDEINRANLSRVFGELMYLLEYRDEQIPLAGGNQLSIPQNVRIIGTMNTADRSIALVDYALRRRFAFLSLQPNYSVLHKRLSTTTFPVVPLVNLLEQVNTAIKDPHYQLGISFFLGSDLERHLQDIWEMEIVPYLEEYFFDQATTVDQFHWHKIAGQLGL